MNQPAVTPALLHVDDHETFSLYLILLKSLKDFDTLEKIINGGNFMKQVIIFKLNEENPI